MSTAVVFVGGPHRLGHDGTAPGPRVPPWTHPGLDGSSADLVIAADSGLHLANAVGWRVDRVVGDMDSVDASALDAARAGGAEIHVHPGDKDSTDLELALDEVVASSCSSVLVVGADAGRLDHLFASLLSICSTRYAELSVRAWLGTTLVIPVRSAATVTGPVGAAVSLLAVHGPATGVSTVGLRWPLDDAVLRPGTSLGVSNEFAVADAEVRVGDGCVAVIVPTQEELL